VEKSTAGTGGIAFSMKNYQILLSFTLFLFLSGCQQTETVKPASTSGSALRHLLARAEFVPIKEEVLYSPFSTEVIELTPEGSQVKTGEEIARLSPGDRVDKIMVESADLEKISATLELKNIRQKMAIEIEEAKLKLTEIDRERARLEYERACNNRDWLRILELEEGLKLEKIRLAMLQRQVQAAQKLVSRGFAAQQELLQNQKDFMLNQLNASLTVRLIPFLNDKADDKKVYQAFEVFEKAKLACEVASYSRNRNLADYNYDCNEEKRNYEEKKLQVKSIEGEIASLTVIAPGNGLLLYGNTYTGSEFVKVRPGSQVYPGISMLRVVDPDKFGVTFALDPKETSLASVGNQLFFRPDPYPELLIPCEVAQTSPIALEISGGRPDGRTMVNVEASVKEKYAAVKLGYSGTVFNPEVIEIWKKAFSGNRRHKVSRRNFFRKTSTTGDVKPASFSYIVSMSNSKLSFLEDEGKSVEEGSVVARIDNAEVSQNLSDTEIELRKFREELQLLIEKNQVENEQLKRQLEVKEGALEVARLKHAALLKNRDEDKIIDLKRSLELIDAKIDLANEKIRHTSELKRKGLRSDLELMQAETEAAALQKDRAINAYKLELEEGGPTRRSVALSQLEVEKARVELEKTRREVEQGQITNAMNVKIKELEIRKLEIRMKEYQRLIEMAEIKAPAPGVVIHSETHRSSGGLGKAKVGDEVYTRVPFMQVAEMANLQIHTEVSEMDVKFVKPGDQVKVILKGNSVSSFPGWVSSISYIARTDFKARQDAVVRVVIDLVSPEHGVTKIAPAFRPGQSCEVEFQLYDVQDALVLPFDAVIPFATGPCVIKEDLVPAPVELLFSDGLQGYVVQSGLTEGDEIILMEALND
jgi:multidrug resistance efflux pump